MSMSHEYIAGGFYDFESEISMEETQRMVFWKRIQWVMSTEGEDGLSHDAHNFVSLFSTSLLFVGCTRRRLLRPYDLSS